MVSLTHDIDMMCKENLQTIEEIIQVFNLKQIKRPFYATQMKTHFSTDTSLVTIVKRQIVTGIILTVGAITSLVSLFTSYELMSMTTSSDTEDDLVDNNNNIITSLQAHESSIQREKQTIKQIKTHLDNLEKYLSIEQRTQDTYLNLFAVKMFGTSTTQHLQRIQDGLYQLLKNKLSPQLVPLKKIEGTIQNLTKIANNRGYRLAIKTNADAFMVDTSFVAYENGHLIVLTHVPMYKELHLMKLLEYQQTPLLLQNGSSQQITIKPQKPIIAINNDLTLYNVYSREEIEHDCKTLRDKTYCTNKNIVKRTTSKDCTLALYNKQKDNIINECLIETSSPQEMITQINSTTFFVYTPEKTSIHITCHEGEDTEKRK